MASKVMQRAQRTAADLQLGKAALTSLVLALQRGKGVAGLSQRCRKRILAHGVHLGRHRFCAVLRGCLRLPQRPLLQAI